MHRALAFGTALLLAFALGAPVQAHPGRAATWPASPDAFAAVILPPSDSLSARNALAPGRPAPGDSAKSDSTRPAVVDTLRVPLIGVRGRTVAFVAMPHVTEPVPAVVVVHEWWGLNAQIRAVAMRLAALGYVAIVPDLYRGKVADDPEMAHTLARGLPDERALADLDAATAWLVGSGRVGKNGVGILGFCLGGRFAELAALQSKRIAACVMFYGQPETNPKKLGPLRAPLLAHFGAEDQGIGADQVEALKAGLAKAGKKRTEVYVYAGAGHAFMNETRPSYRPDAAKLAWDRTTAFLEESLKSR